MAESKDSKSKSLELLVQNQRALYGYILSLVASTEMADDILQQTNVILCQKIEDFDGRAKFITWATRIAYFQILAEYKRQGRNASHLDESTLEQLSVKVHQRIISSDDRRVALQHCIKLLSDEHQEMIQRRYEPGNSVSSLAKHYGRTVSSLWVTLHRIRKTLSSCINRKLASD